MEISKKTILVTGASGYLGREFVDEAIRANLNIICLGRSCCWHSKYVKSYPWRLGDDVPAQINDVQIDAVFHFAHKWTDISGEITENINFIGTKKIIIWSQQQKVKKFVFISSLSARDTALNFYGKLKYKIEELLQQKNEISVRVGLVYGGSKLGIWGTILKITKRLSVIPIIGGDNLVQPVHIKDLSVNLLKLIETTSFQNRIVSIANYKPITFSKFLKIVALEYHDHKLSFIYLPKKVVLLILNILFFLKFEVGFLRERILGLISIEYVDTKNDADHYNFFYRDLEDGLYDAYQKRKLIMREGYYIYKALNRKYVTFSDMRNYNRSLKFCDNELMIRFPYLFKLYPRLINLFYPHSVKNNTNGELLIRRFHMISLMIESSGGKKEFEYYEKHSLIKIALILLWTTLMEMLVLPSRVVGGKVFWSKKITK